MDTLVYLMHSTIVCVLHVFLSNQKNPEFSEWFHLSLVVSCPKTPNPLMWRRSSLIKERPPRKLVPKDECTSSPRSRVGPVTWSCVEDAKLCWKFRNERFQNNLDFMSLLFLNKTQMINQREFFSNIFFYVFLCEMKINETYLGAFVRVTIEMEILNGVTGMQ